MMDYRVNLTVLLFAISNVMFDVLRSWIRLIVIFFILMKSFLGLVFSDTSDFLHASFYENPDVLMNLMTSSII